MDFTTYECDVAPDDGFTEANDIFRRKPFALALTNILEKSSRSLSIMIDARWGEGKTTFLKMWAGELRKADFPVIYFDAFKTDYCSDPFEALSACITDFVETNLSDKETLKSIVEQSANRLRIISKAGLKIGAQALVHHMIGENAATTLKEIEGNLADAAEKGIESFWKKEIQSFQKEAQNIEKFKAAITEISEKYKAAKKPLIIIVDELDRCKPSYAIALLERIKHFMTADKVHYVHGVNYEQLAASAGAIYGAKVDTDTYFQKFFDFKFALPTSDERAYYSNSAAIYAHRLFAQNEQKFDFFRRYSDARNTFANLSERIRPTLRTLERASDQLILAYSLAPNRHSFVQTLLISCILIKHCNKPLYDQLVQGTISFEEIETFFRMKYAIEADYSDDASYTTHYALRCWGRCLKQNIPEDDEGTRSVAANVSISDYSRFPSKLATRYIEQFGMQ